MPVTTAHARHGRGNGRRLRVLIADRDRILAESLEAVLVSRGYEVVGSAENGRRAVGLARQRHPDVAVLDVGMPILSGLDAARQILRAAPQTAVLLITGQGEGRVVHEALRIGVHGFLVKAQGLEDLLQAIRDVGHGAIYISPFYSRGVLDAFRNPARDPAALTERELEMLRLISDGKTMKQAAVAMAISVRTAECHRAHIMGKLHIHDTAGLVRFAIRQGLVVA